MIDDVTLKRDLTSLRGHLSEALGDDLQAVDVEARWDRWGPDLLAGLARVYPQPGVAERVVELIAAGFVARPRALRQRDRERVLRPDWFQRSDQLGYAAYADRFGGTLRGVADRVEYLRELGVTYLHLMPLLAPRPGDSDGGYAVMDYGRVHPDLGTMDDLEHLADVLHEAGISLTLDLVLNHVAAEHEWGVAARAGDPKYRDYFRLYPDRTEPDAYERTLPEVFPAFAPGNFTWDDDLGAWVWTTFNHFQWDLNWANPEVLFEFVDIILSLANRGVDCLRLDAIAFLWKRLGTNCQNQPEVHAITQVLRSAARIAAPSLIFKAEAIVAPGDLVAYLGRGQHAGRVSDMAYHNSLMVQIWSALAARDGRLVAESLSRIPDIPTTAAWATYVRCHDDIGWAIDDNDCAAIGWSGWDHRAFLSDFYVGAHESSFAEGAAFQENPITGDRRVSGSAASLAGLGRATDARQRRTAIDRLLLAYAMVLGFGGMPLVYMGDELALLNDDDFARDPDHAGDNRWLHRPAMRWDLVDQRHTADTDASMMFNGLRHLVGARAALEALHASVPTRVYPTSQPPVVQFVRKHPAGDLVQVYNLSESPVALPAWEVHLHGTELTFEQLTQREVYQIEGRYLLPPYAAWWLTARP